MAHAAHAFAPIDGEKVPGGQRTHAPFAAGLEIEPRGHAGGRLLLHDEAPLMQHTAAKFSSPSDRGKVVTRGESFDVSSIGVWQVDEVHAVTGMIEAGKESDAYFKLCAQVVPFESGISLFGLKSLFAQMSGNVSNDSH